ncbi:hypothetical protein N7367_06160 [Stenotrophomonas sp. GD04145]|uniref:hypothetical protein n=1 Tax=Stenotrophomonas sp. GD04145 TaxID=2975436 RepID=UPI00244C5E6C|nr:hypothetical protein [Stenotrophomonas sp. GD04145]MDH0171027.1 hypothetical protein [Stenotrophomonas sp. GD04145]
MNPIAHVEIPASDLARAIAFYQQWLQVRIDAPVHLHGCRGPADAGHWRVAEICDSEGNRIALQAPVTP